MKFTGIAMLVIGLYGCAISAKDERSVRSNEKRSTNVAILSTEMNSDKIPTLNNSSNAMAKATRCYCDNNWSFPMSPCNQTQCMNLCLHGQGYTGSCF